MHRFPRPLRVAALVLGCAQGAAVALAQDAYHLPLAGTVRPYVGASAGPFLDVVETRPSLGASTSTTEIKGGGVLGAGVETFFWKKATLSLDTRVTLVSGRSAELHVTLGLGWTCGQGRR